MAETRSNRRPRASQTALGDPVGPFRGSKRAPASDSPRASGDGIDLDAARAFFAALDPEAEAFTFQTIPEAPGATGPARTFHASFDKLAPTLAKLNESGHGVFVSVQHMDGAGRKAANLSRIRACFADIDGRAGQKLPRKWDLQPNAVVETSPGSFHVWWFLRDEPSLELWRGLQRSIVAKLRSDPAGHADVTKVLRLPGFLHRKGKPHRVTLVDSSKFRVGLIEVQAAFPPVERKRPKPTASSVHRADVDVAVLKSALAHLARTPHPGAKGSQSYADSYQAWWSFGAAIHRALGDGGYEVWHDWSRSSERYSEQACRTKWNSFASAGEYTGQQVTLGSIYFTARRHGWSYAEAQMRSTLNSALAKFNNNSKAEQKA